MTDPKLSAVPDDLAEHSATWDHALKARADGSWFCATCADIKGATRPVASNLELWGHDCVRCGNTVPMGEGPCDSCGKDDCLLPLYFKPDELEKTTEGL